MSSTAQGSHSLAFRVMRLCRPSLHVDSPLRFDAADLLAGEDIFDDPSAAAELPRLIDSHIAKSDDSSDLSYTSRFLLHDPTDAMGLSGLLMLPQAFGAIYLGETFCSYISINNSSNFEVREIIIKAEIQTDRQRILLLDTSKSPVESIRAGGRYDFIVEHDVKELGAHTLVCTALYNDGDGDRKYLPQFFKFIVANPLSVRTKVRIVKVGNYIPGDLHRKPYKNKSFYDQVDFEPAQNWSVTKLKADVHHSQKNSKAREIFEPPILIKAGGGIHNYLYQLTSSSNVSAPLKVEGSNILGKLQIIWRSNLGEPGRLQTQQILGTPITPKEVELQAVEIPSLIKLNRPFQVNLKLTNHTDRDLGPFEVLLSQADPQEEKVVKVNGLRKMALPQVEAFGSRDFHLNLIASKLGVQRISGITVYNKKDNKAFDSLPDLEIFVDFD